MNKLVSILIVLVMAFGIFGTAQASTPAPGGPFNTAFRVQNLETTNAQCSYAFYAANGVAAYTSGITTVIPGDSLFVYVPNLAVDDGTYSAVVSCDRKVAAVTNFSDANSGASHAGVASPGTIWYAPGIYDNYYSYYSNIIVQNASTIPVDITVSIYQAGSTVAVDTQTASAVPANASVAFEQEGRTNLLSNVAYSAKITGTGDIAPIVNIYGRLAYDNQLFSYNPFKVGSTTAYAPLIMNNYYGYNTALTVQNIGTVATNITILYSNGLSKTFNNVAANASILDYTPTSGLPSGNTLYGAKITTSGQPVVALINESNSYNRAASYAGFPSGSTEARAPIVMKRYYSYNSSVTCQNVGTVAATMSISYSGVGGTTTSPSIAVNATHLFYQPNDALLAGYALNWLGSATITSAQPIICVVNQDMNEGDAAITIQDQLFTYEGIKP